MKCVSRVMSTQAGCAQYMQKLSRRATEVEANLLGDLLEDGYHSERCSFKDWVAGSLGQQ